VKARIHSLCGWLCFRVGCRAAARGHYERVLQLRGDDFAAYVHLGRIAFSVGDYAGWRREFEHARRADPERFTRLRHTFELFEPRIAGTNFDDTGERATWRSLRPFGPGAGKRASGLRSESSLDGSAAGSSSPASGPPADASASLDAGLELPPDQPALRGDDCLSETERLRLRKLGPIAPRELKACDLDDLSRRLSG
ncbi:MAG: hypothetical protein Q7V88_00175, partial [Actinomycetota bacterium]|nr:hypothetical protein [Actinomycetota bacterium]